MYTSITTQNYFNLKWIHCIDDCVSSSSGKKSCVTDAVGYSHHVVTICIGAIGDIEVLFIITQYET